MKILVLAIIVFFSQFSFVYAAKPFCQENANEFSLTFTVGLLGSSVVGYKIGKGEISFDAAEKEFDNLGSSITSKVKIFCSNQENKNKNLSTMDIFKLLVIAILFNIDIISSILVCILS